MQFIANRLAGHQLTILSLPLPFFTTLCTADRILAAITLTNPPNQCFRYMLGTSGSNSLNTGVKLDSNWLVRTPYGYFIVHAGQLHSTASTAMLCGLKFRFMAASSV
jgi:hypothetical protein